LSGIQIPLKPLPLEIPPPYFSVRRTTGQDNQEYRSCERFTTGLIGYLEREIIYWLSWEKRAEIINFAQDVVWVAVDVLGFLCEMYEHPPGVNEPVVRTWRETTAEIWKQFLEGDDQPFDEADPLYLKVLAAFDRLAAMARKYPSMEWSGAERD